MQERQPAGVFYLTRKPKVPEDTVKTW